jgi:glycosyltransferase involved in cell wall biosynthesis
MPAVSVVIPTYNRAEMLAQALRSVLAQTFTDYEVIVVDDGSTDGTAEVVESFTDQRIKYLRQENRGSSAARNAGVEKAEGKYVAFLDSDDAWLPEKLEVQVAAFERHPTVGLVSCRSLTIDPSNECAFPLELLRPPGDEIVADFHAEIIVSNRFMTPALMVKRAVIEKVGGFDENLVYAEDWDLWIRIARECECCDVGRYLAAVRVHPESATSDRAGTLEADLTVLNGNLNLAPEDVREETRLRAEMLIYAAHGIPAMREGIPRGEDWLREAQDRAVKLGEPDALNKMLVGLVVSRTKYSDGDRVRGAKLLAAAAEIVRSGGGSAQAGRLLRDYWSLWVHATHRLGDHAACLTCVRGFVASCGVSAVDRGIAGAFVRSAAGTLFRRAVGRTVFPIERELQAILSGKVERQAICPKSAS